MPNLKKELPIALKYKSAEGQSGVALFMVIIVMTIILAVVLGLTAIFLGQAVILREMGYSVIAFSAAEAGIERAVYELRLERRGITNPVLSWRENLHTFPNGATYRVTATPRGTTGCPFSPSYFYCINSVGTYRGSRRTIFMVD